NEPVPVPTLFLDVPLHVVAFVERTVAGHAAREPQVVGRAHPDQRRAMWGDGTRSGTDPLQHEQVDRRYVVLLGKLVALPVEASITAGSACRERLRELLRDPGPEGRVHAAPAQVEVVHVD